MHAEDELAREAVRLYRRYEVEVVEQFSLCPWARDARLEGRVMERVFPEEIPGDLTPFLHAIEGLTTQDDCDVALFLFPRCTLQRLEFEHFVGRLRDAETERHPLGRVPFAMAAFHPVAVPDSSDAERLIPFLRRSPDPTIQLVRQSALDQAKGARQEGTEFVDLRQLTPTALASEPRPALRRRIALHNLQTVERVGAQRLEAVFGDIARDREATYGRILGAAPQPSP